VYYLFILFRQFIHTQDGNDVLQFVVTLEQHLDPLSGLVMFLTHNIRLQDPGRGIKRVHCRVYSQGSDLAAEHRGGVQVGKSGCRSRIGQVICRYIDCLNGCNGALLGGGDAFLQ